MCSPTLSHQQQPNDISIIVRDSTSVELCNISQHEFPPLPPSPREPTCNYHVGSREEPIVLPFLGEKRNCSVIEWGVSVYRPPNNNKVHIETFLNSLDSILRGIILKSMSVFLNQASQTVCLIL
ncbi:hypothetical protein J6590_088543 [Homalodisca vitripennis]|nr:hypothetical protein J6590_088543 [Homalodisca vitripennis]